MTVSNYVPNAAPIETEVRVELGIERGNVVLFTSGEESPHEQREESCRCESRQVGCNYLAFADCIRPRTTSYNVLKGLSTGKSRVGAFGCISQRGVEIQKVQIMCNEKNAVLSTNRSHVVHPGSLRGDWGGEIKAHQDAQVERCPLVRSLALCVRLTNDRTHSTPRNLSNHT